MSEIKIDHQNNYDSFTNFSITLKCPNCTKESHISHVSFPRYELISKYELEHVGIVYRCDICNKPIFLRFQINQGLSFEKNHYIFHRGFQEIIKAQETFEHIDKLPEKVQGDFQEALTCYSSQCFNAFAAMCRRTIQSTSDELGAKGKAQVMNQIKELKALAKIDDATFEILKEIVIHGHDGAHPHLPPLDPDRAEILLELMKDVLYQLFARHKLIAEAAEKRNKKIQE